MSRPGAVALVIILAGLATPAARAEEAAPAARPAAKKEGKKEAPPSRARLSAWRAGAQPPAEVPPTTIVRAAVRKEKAGGGRRKLPARGAPPRDAIEIIWHAPGT